MSYICKECEDPSWTGQDPIKVPRLQTGEYIVEFDKFSDFPETGESGFIYVDLENNDFYKWDIEGEQYVAIGGSSAERDYEKLNHLPAVNGVTLVGDLSTSDLGIDTDIATAVAGEATARDAAIAIETAAREAAISAEATARDAAIASEASTRAAGDTALQTQIDAITSASDVVDVVGTYADLEDYDTSKLSDNDIIKVLQDETHNDAITYYRWIVADEGFTYIGLQGPFYTKSETNVLLGEKQDTLTAGENVTIDENGIISAASTYVTITVTPDMIISEDPITFQFTEAEDAIITNAHNMLIKIDATQVGIGATIFTKSVSNRAGEYVLTNNIASYTASAMTVSDSTANIVVYRHSDMKAVYSVKDLLDEGDITQETGQSEHLLMSQKAITDALANAGGVKVLTEDDYNYPTNNPTSVALWLLDSGVYTFHDASMNVIAKDVGGTIYMDNSTYAIVGGKYTSGGNIVNDIVLLGGANTGIWRIRADGGEINHQRILVNSDIYNYLVSDSTDLALSAAQGKVLKDLIDSLIIKGAGAPTTSTVGTVGQLYEDTTNGDLYQCTAVSGSTYTWEEVGGGSGGGDPVYSTVTTSNSATGGAVYIGNKGTDQSIVEDPTTTDSHYKYFCALPYSNTQSPRNNTICILGNPSQNTDSITIGYNSSGNGSNNTVIGTNANVYAYNGSGVAIGYNSSGVSNGIAIGSSANCGGNQNATVIGSSASSGGIYGTAIGSQAKAKSGDGNVALGAFSETTRQGEVNVGTVSTPYGYNNTNYRVIGGVHDGQSDHDAMTVGQANALIDAINTALSTNIAHIGASS